MILYGLYYVVMLVSELCGCLFAVKVATSTFMYVVQFLHFDSGKTDSRGPIDPNFHGVMIGGALLYALGAFAVSGPLAPFGYLGALTFAGVLGYSFVREDKKGKHNMWWLDYAMNCAFSLALGLPKLVGCVHPGASALLFYCGVRIISDYVRMGVVVRNSKQLQHWRDMNVVEHVQKSHKELILSLAMAQTVSALVAPVPYAAAMSFGSAVALYSTFRVLYQKRMPSVIKLRSSLPEDVVFTYGALISYVMSFMAAFCFAYGWLHPEHDYVVAYGRRLCLAMGLGSLYRVRLLMLSGKHYADEPRMVEKASLPLHLAYAGLSIANEFTQSLYKVRLFLSFALTSVLLLGYLVADVASPDVKRPTPQEFLWSAVHCGLATWMHLDLQYYSTSQITPWSYPYVVDRMAPVLIGLSMANLVMPRVKPAKSWKLGDWHSTNSLSHWVK